jgi:hypothetical protein
LGKTWRNKKKLTELQFCAIYVQQWSIIKMTNTFFMKTLVGNWKFSNFEDITRHNVGKAIVARVFYSSKGILQHQGVGTTEGCLQNPKRVSTHGRTLTYDVDRETFDGEFTSQQRTSSPGRL